MFIWKVSDDDEYPKVICPSCKCQLDILVKFIDDLLDGQLFLKNINKIYKSKQFTTTEYNVALDDEKTTNCKNNFNTICDNVEFVCETCGLMLADENDLRTHLANHRGI